MVRIYAGRRGLRRNGQGKTVPGSPRRKRSDFTHGFTAVSHETRRKDAYRKQYRAKTHVQIGEMESQPILARPNGGAESQMKSNLRCTHLVRSMFTTSI